MLLERKTHIRLHRHTHVCDWMHTHADTAHCMTYKQGMSWKVRSHMDIKQPARPSQHKEPMLRRKWS